ncbi:MAG TPA: hypothetical protein VGH73_10965 [Thermoanaerobaculia bacterium]|jgi:hypothetical protein
MSLSEKIHQLNREIGDSVERALAELRQEISQRLNASNQEIQRRLEEFTPALPSSYLAHEDLAPAAERELAPNARRSALRDLREGLAAIDRARSQAEILAALLRQSAGYASRVAVLLVRGDELRGWGGEGFGDADAALRGLVLESPGGAWSRLAQAPGALRLNAADCAALASRIDSPLPHDGVLVPIVLRDRVAAGLYADRQDGGELGIEALQILAHAAAQAIETLPFRERSATPTLSLEEGEESGAAAPATAAPAQPAPSAEAPEAPEAAAEPEPAHPEPHIEEPAQETAAPSAQAPTVPESVASWESLHVTEAMPLPGFPSQRAGSPLSTVRAPEPEPPAPPAPEEAPRYPRSVEPEPAAPAADPSPDATVLLPRSALPAAEPAAPPPAPAPLRPVPAPAPEEPAGQFDRGSAMGSGTPEVRPPSDVDGPGWAFATSRVPALSKNDESLHEEARRLARLLVSEIKLYNEDQVEEGRRNRDIYERLKEDIDRSRQMYDERVDPQILRSTDYFYQELVRILASGDSKALGI